MRRFACLDAVRGLYGHKSGPQGVMLCMIGKPTLPLDRPICGAVSRLGLGLAENRGANLRIVCEDYIALVGLPIARCCAITPIAPFLG
jgi:hypothetical protein